jgi:hypothetical protein
VLGSYLNLKDQPVLVLKLFQEISDRLFWFFEKNEKQNP